MGCDGAMALVKRIVRMFRPHVVVAMAMTTWLGGYVAGAGPDVGAPRDVNRTGQLIATLSSDKDGSLSRVVADTPMFLANTKDPTLAPRIGFVRAGTPIADHAIRVQDGAFVQVGVPFLRPGDAGTVRKGFPNGHSDDYLYVYLPAHVGAASAQSRQPTGPSDVRYGLFREIATEPGQPGFAFIHCGKVRVLEQRGHYMRVAAEFNAGELYGWVDAAETTSWDRLCDEYVLKVRGWNVPFFGLPRGYEPVDDEYTAPRLLAFVKRKSTVFRPGRTEAGLVCKGWQFIPSRDPGAGKLGLIAADLPSGCKEVSSKYGVHGTNLAIRGPVCEGRDGTMTSRGRHMYFSVVRVLAKRLLVVQVRSATAKGYYKPPPVVGVRRSTVETWYGGRDECEEALKSAEQILPDSSSRP